MNEDSIKALNDMVATLSFFNASTDGIDLIFRALLQPTPTSSEVSEAIKHLEQSETWLSNKDDASIETLITAAQEAKRLPDWLNVEAALGDRKAVCDLTDENAQLRTRIAELESTNEFIDKKLGEAYRELEKAPKPEVVTVDQMQEYINDYRADELMRRHPNGLIIAPAGRV